MDRSQLSATQSSRFGTRLTPLTSRADLPPRWHGTPIEEFIAAHNFDHPIEGSTEPRLLIVSCIEYRFSPLVPHNFAYVMRTAGGRLSHESGSEFALSYILAKGVRHIAMVGHNDCGMTKVPQFKPNLIKALVEQGWDEATAQEFIEENADRFTMDDEINSLEREYKGMREQFKNVEIAPLFVSLASSRLHLPNWFLRYMVEEKH